MSRQEVQELEDRASEHYLRAEYREACEAWEQVLLLEPGNEQAAEGIRLASVYIEGTEGMPADLGEAPVPVPPPAVPVEMGSDTMLLDPELLDSIVHAPAGAPAKAVAAAPAPAHVEPDRQGGGFDFGSLEELDAIPLFTTPPPAPLSASSPAPASASAPAVGELEASNELHRRVQDLLAEVRSLHGEGKNQEALGVIARIAILDEENAEAHELEGSVRTAMERAVLQVDGWISEGVQAFDRGEIEAARDLFERVLAVSPEHREALHYLEAMPARGVVRAAPGSAPPPGGSEPFHADELLPGMSTSGAPATSSGAMSDEAKRKLIEELDGAAEAVPLARPAGLPPARPQAAFTPREKAPAVPPPRMTRKSRMPLLAGGAVALVLVAGGAWWLLGSSKQAPSNAAAQAPSQRPSRPAPGAPRGAAQAAAAPEAPAADGRSLGQLIEDARRSLAAGDYAAAVVDFDRALKRDPENHDAKEGLTKAGEAYKAHKMEQEQLDRVKMAFAGEEFTSALHMLYRLPATADKPRLDRYKANGWYNLGVVALRAGECQQARAHFGEALGVKPDDEDAKRLKSFAEKYDDVPKDRLFYDRVEALSFRGLDD